MLHSLAPVQPWPAAPDFHTVEHLWQQLRRLIDCTGRELFFHFLAELPKGIRKQHTHCLARVCDALQRLKILLLKCLRHQLLLAGEIVHQGIDDFDGTGILEGGLQLLHSGGVEIG